MRRLSPSPRLRGEICLPGDKSVSHRGLLFGALAHEPSRLTGLLESADVAATARAVRALGAQVRRDGAAWIVEPPARLIEPEDVVDCGNSGTSMRLLAGLVAAEAMHVVLTGDASLRGRPMRRITGPLRRLGAHIDGRQDGALPPLVIRGPVDRVERLELPIASAQVKSALLLAARRVGITLREPARAGMGSRDHTERMLRAMGAPLSQDAEGWWHLDPVERLDPLDVLVPGDVSSAAFLLVAASLVPDSEVVLRGVGINPTRTGVLDALRLMGAHIQVEPIASRGEPVADLTVRAASLRGAEIGGALALRALDELPVLAVAAAFAEGTTVISDAGELRVKESDRIARTAAGLRALGVDVEERPDGLVIHGSEPEPRQQAAVVDATGDHRIAMAFAVAGLVAGPVELVGADVSTSYPAFFDDLEALRGA